MDGRLTDGQGRVVNFKNCVIIMTSNIGSSIIHETGAIGFSVTQDRNHDGAKKLLDVLKSHFRPEFLNRVDDIVVFSQLSKENLTKIVDIQLHGLEKVLAGRKLSLAVSQAAKEKLLEEGYDPSYGARPMRRAIQRLIQDPLALKLLTGDFVAGDAVHVDVDEEGKMAFTKAAVAVEIPALV